MLPTTGHFREIDCPYHEASCDRPYCHFKHRKKIQEAAEVTPAPVDSDIPTYNPTPKSELAKARSHIPISYVPDLGVIRPLRSKMRPHITPYTINLDKPITYNPTPLSILSKSNAFGDPLIFKAEDSSDSGNSELESKRTTMLLPDLTDEFEIIDEIIGESNCDRNEKNVEDDELKEDMKPMEEQPSEMHDSTKHSESNGEVYKSKKRSRSDVSKSSKYTFHTSKDPEIVKSDEKKEHRSSKVHKSDEKKNLKAKDKEEKYSRIHKSEKESKSSGGQRDIKDKRTSSKSRSSKKGEQKPSVRHSSEKDVRKKSSSDKDRKVHTENIVKVKYNSKHKDSKSGVKIEVDKGDRKNRESHKRRLRHKYVEIKNDQVAKTESTSSKLNFNDIDSSFCSPEEYSEPEEPDIEEECYRIFSEYQPSEPDILGEPHEAEAIQAELDSISIGRKRIAHERASNQNECKVAFKKPNPQHNPAQAMINRFKVSRLQQLQKEDDTMIDEIKQHVLNHRPKAPAKKNLAVMTYPPKKVSQPSTSSSCSLIDDILGNKPKPKRIAPVMNVSSIQRAKAKIEEMTKRRVQMASNHTAIQTHSKNGPRVAHVPEFAISIMPELLETDKSKLPLTIRNKFLKMLVEECYKLYISKSDANERAVNEEFKCYERCSALTTYKNSMMLAVSRLRREQQERDATGLGPLLSGEPACSDKKDSSALKGLIFYNNVSKYLLTDEELELHGFPRQGKIQGRAVIKELKPKPKFHHGDNERVCCRCSKRYEVDNDGFPLHQQECLYHPLKKRTFRGESFFLCCRSSDDTGCATSSTHVSDSIDSVGELEGYQVTMKPECDEDPRSFAVYALDCEMCYTTKGLELTRVTVVNLDLKTVYETLVKPLNPIVDYNTRFSGITKEQMDRTATNILQVQANMLHLCNSKTILIGHSLESDMKALKIVHSCVVDTSVMFPHKFGLPHKRALRQLASEYLKKIIQNSVSGHDSAEDALSCMELVLWKLKEDSKLGGVKL